MSEWWSKPQRIVQTNLRLIDADLDPDRLVDEALSFGATAIMFNVGGIFAWYPTELPLQATNPYIKDDVVGRMLAACRKKGLNFIGRFDLSKGTDVAYKAHADWFCVNAAGEPFLYNGTYAGCVNGGWYQQQAFDVIEETVRRFDLEALFVNMFGYVRSDYSHRYLGYCRCENCKRGFAEFSGGKEIPAYEDLTDPTFRLYLQFQDHTSGALGKRLYEHVKKLRPTTGVANFGSRPDFFRAEANRSVVRSDGDWPYQSGGYARYARSAGAGAPRTVGITHFFDFPWRFAGECEGLQGLRLAQAIANGSEPHYYFLGRFDQLDGRSIPLVREFFTYHAKHQVLYNQLESAARVAVYHSKKTERYGLADDRKDLHVDSSPAYKGAFRSLLESGLAFDVVSDRRAADSDFLEQLSRYEVVVMPDCACLSDDEARAIDQFVFDGGTVLATGRCGIAQEFGDPRQAPALQSFPMREIPHSTGDMRASYILIGQDELDFPQTRAIMLDGHYYEGAVKSGARALGRVQPPQRFGPPEFSFPEVPPSDLPAVVEHVHGLGRFVYLAWQPDLLYQLHSMAPHRQLIVQLVSQYSKPAVVLSATSRLEMTVQRNTVSKEIVVHLVNYSGQSGENYEDPIFQHGLRVGVRGAGGSAVEALKSGRSLPLGPADEEGYRWVDVPPLGYFEALVYAPESQSWDSR
jgi:hypothetical protein